MLLQNGSFEATSDWTLTGSAAYSTDQYAKGRRSMLLTCDNTISSQIDQSLDVGDTFTGEGLVLRLPFYTAQLAPLGIRILAVYIDKGTGSYPGTYDFAIFSTESDTGLPNTAPSVDGEWSYVEVPFTVAGAGAVRVRLIATRQGFEFFDQTATWHVDDIRLERDMPKWDALNGLITRLKAINGAPTYNNDLSNRVYTRELFPDDAADVKMPFLSVVEQVTTYPNWQRGVEADYRVYVRGFVADTSPDPRDTSTMQSLAELHDDIWNTLMVDETLGGTVHDLEVVSSDAPPAQVRGPDWAGIEFDIRIKQWFQQSELSP